MKDRNDDLIAELTTENSRLWKLIAELMLKNEQLRQSLEAIQKLPSNLHADGDITAA